jgi:hypothetical protein
MKPVIFTQEELKKLCREWQAILGLSDWIVEVEISRKENFCKNKFEGKWLNGLCQPTLQTKVAYIHILDPIDYPDNAVLLQDMESTLIHELIHLHTCNYNHRFEDDSVEWDYLEQTVEMLARALIKTRRGNADGSLFS